MKNLNQFKAFEISETNEVKGGSIKTGKVSCPGAYGQCYTDKWYLFKKNINSVTSAKHPHVDTFDPKPV